MKRRFFGGALGVGLTCLLAMVPLAGRTQELVYNFSPVNQFGIQLTAAYWNPIIAYVSEKSGVKLNLKIGRTSADTTSYVLAKEVEFVFSNHLFSPEREQLGWKVFGRRQTPALHGEIVVPADSPVTALAQLSGKAAAAGANSQFQEGYARRENKKFRALWTSEPYQDLAWMASGKVPDKEVNAVAQTFFK
jgi:phosphonate transport system substrate-binding protein